jgi:DNA-binding response OmpR family regulator
LLASADTADRTLLAALFRQQNWAFSSVETLQEARAFLHHTTVPLVISERDLPQGCWKDLLLESQGLPGAPLLVVVSRLADDCLWSEVLHFGGYDVLVKPFYPVEALRVFRHAFARWQAVTDLVSGQKVDAASRRHRAAAGGQ